MPIVSGHTIRKLSEAEIELGNGMAIQPWLVIEKERQAHKLLLDVLRLLNEARDER